MSRWSKAVLAAWAVGVSGVAFALPATPPAGEADRALELLKTAVSFKTVEGFHQIPAFANYLAGQFRQAGFAESDIRFQPIGETGALTVTWPGTDKALKPLVISDHMDVVAADPKDWTRDPFKPVVENGYVYGRGSLDNKFDVAMVVTTLIRMKQEGYKPRRTIILALSGDEETAMATTRVLAGQLKNAELVLNGDGGGGTLDENGKPMVFGFQAGEKTYADFEISFTSPGGHSSRPGSPHENAIYRLAKAIDRIASYQFPVQSNELTVAYLKATAEKTPGALGDAMRRFAANPKDAEAAATLSADPEYIGQVRTTCVATMLQGGHALNALPQKASVSVNCRIFPGVKVADVEATLKQVVADKDATFATIGDPTASDASPLRPDVMDAVKKAVDLAHPGVPVVPNMAAGASDSLHFRANGVPSYGVSAVFMKPSDDFAHGLNERAPVAAIPGALVQWHSLLITLSSR
ncbi:M20/M25/M40 family metallo-hydrolase [Sphingomonas sp. PR090111-T3T-6A]|uniref:M20/M25/M40 family metallo-hydrolase n=1 Tax=Sphingomonas sp. PR090111-T3T-6A TaxID=685778 RepID=UPI000378F548|nr:M20/M25/M40 family metallo-hydrolase [Sphingomonas sp. PR090111-T3T-6A]